MRTAIALITVLASTTLTGCESTADPSAQLPDGVRVEVYQNRSDVAARRLEISVSNDSDQSVVITSAVLDAAQFLEPAAWPESSDAVAFAPGRTIDLPVAIPDANCSPVSGAVTVTLSFQIAGVDGVVTVPATDRFDQLPGLHSQDCLIQALTEIATITFRPQVQTQSRDGVEIGLVELDLTPTGNPGDFTVLGVADTVLLALANRHGRRTNHVRLGSVVDGTGEPVRVRIPILPNRCDPHAVAEDKQGTIFTFDVVAPDGSRATVGLPASDIARSSIYRFVQEACGY